MIPNPIQSALATLRECEVRTLLIGGHYFMSPCKKIAPRSTTNTSRYLLQHDHRGRGRAFYRAYRDRPIKRHQHAAAADGERQ